MTFESDLRKMKKNMDGFEVAYLNAVAVGLAEEGYGLDAKMVPLIPVRTGRTKSSHFVSLPQSIQAPQVIVGVGTNYAPYLRVKGESKANTKRSKAGSANTAAGTNITLKSDNFLRIAFQQHQSGYVQRLGKRVADAVKNRRTIGTVSRSAPEKPE